MPGALTLSLEGLHGFLLVLTRVAATFALVPLPQLRHSSTAVKIVLSLSITMALQSVWPMTPVSLHGGLGELASLLGEMVVEAGFGVAIGLVVALVSEAFTLSMQLLGIQAGYGYASTID